MVFLKQVQFGHTLSLKKPVWQKKTGQHVASAPNSRRRQRTQCKSLILPLNCLTILYVCLESEC